MSMCGSVPSLCRQSGHSPSCLHNQTKSMLGRYNPEGKREMEGEREREGEEREKTLLVGEGTKKFKEKKADKVRPLLCTEKGGG